MKNYWLSEYKNEDPEDQSPEEEPEDDGEQDVHSKLNNRQNMMYKMYEMIVEEEGLFEQDSKANGAHYAPSKKNPFIKDGLVCSNCVYFRGGQACEMVKGRIEPEGICKLWIIPEELIKN